ncbi:MAG: 4Fe-4S dicluster domain-containing protein [Deltaproteobacteria bacterium]|nr:4Fe-4S dicluster domain-containing protein [Deltaproteobacteria bacterium]
MLAAAATEAEASPHASDEHSPQQSRYRTRHWGMAIDLDRCSACGACAVACRQENNVPSFGPDPTFRGAAPEWMSLIWRDPDHERSNPELIPMPCMHCVDPPCVKVCPVGATYKDPEGITMQIWDRCIGCRYCMVACPYSRRSFNWAHPELDETEVQMLNPDVATRPGGVVEKCTFCNHRIKRLRQEKALEGKEIEDPDAQRLTACASACPALAITFGDLSDPTSQVSQLAASSRAIRLLENLGTHPSVYYLKRDRQP